MSELLLDLLVCPIVHLMLGLLQDQMEDSVQETTGMSFSYGKKWDVIEEIEERKKAAEGGDNKMDRFDALVERF